MIIIKQCCKCKYNIERRGGYLLEMDSPFIQCPKCSTWQIDRKRKEYIMWGTIDYFKYFFTEIAVNMVLSFIVFILFMGLVSAATSDERLMVIPEIISFLFFIFLTLLMVKKFKKEKDISNERVSNKKYLKQLYDSNLISEKKYNEYKKR